MLLGSLPPTGTVQWGRHTCAEGVRRVGLGAGLQGTGARNHKCRGPGSCSQCGPPGWPPTHSPAPLVGSTCCSPAETGAGEALLPLAPSGGPVLGLPAHPPASRSPPLGTLSAGHSTEATEAKPKRPVWPPSWQTPAGTPVSLPPPPGRTAWVLSVPCVTSAGPTGGSSVAPPGCHSGITHPVTPRVVTAHWLPSAWRGPLPGVLCPPPRPRTQRGTPSAVTALRQRGPWTSGPGGSSLARSCVLAAEKPAEAAGGAESVRHTARSCWGQSRIHSRLPRGDKAVARLLTATVQGRAGQHPGVKPGHAEKRKTTNGGKRSCH